MVEWKKLGEVCKLERGVRVVKKELQEEGQIPVYQNSLTPLGFYEKNNYPKNTPFVICAGAAGEIGYSDKAFWAADDCTCIVCSSINSKFVYYCLMVKQHLLKSQVRKASVPRLSKDVIGKIQIPIPSISEQNRMVGILDTFTASIENLKEQIKQRHKQYEYYRDEICDLEGKEGVEMKTLPEISKNCDRARKPITSSKRVAGIYPYYGASGIVDYVESYIFDGDYLLISEDGANLVMRTTPIAFSISGKNWVNNHAHVLKFNDLVTQKYVEIYLNMINLDPWINGAAQPKLNQDNLNRIEIPLPSLEEQSRIVSILDTFEASISNLEAQLKEREKQYEYYRNKLLTFE